MHKTLRNESERQGTAAEMKSGLRKNGIARQQRDCHSLRKLPGPGVVLIFAIAETDQEAGETAPASRRNGLLSDLLALSSSLRIIRPLGILVFRLVSSSHSGQIFR